MKKWLLIVPLVMLNVLLYVYRAHADGNVTYGQGPQISATGSNYAWPSVVPSTPGAVLVNNGVNAFAWSNNPVTGVTTASVPSTQLITLSSVTTTQLNAMQPASVGQIFFCGNCTSSNICVSSGTGIGAWVTISTNSNVNLHCN